MPLTQKDPMETDGQQQFSYDVKNILSNKVVYILTLHKQL